MEVMRGSIVQERESEQRQGVSLCLRGCANFPCAVCGALSDLGRSPHSPNLLLICTCTTSVPGNGRVRAHG